MFSNRQRAHRSMRRRRISAVKRSHGILSAAAPKRCRSFLSRPWSSSLGHEAPPPRISSKYSLPVYVTHGSRLQFLFQFSPTEWPHLLSSHSIVLQSTYKILLCTSYGAASFHFTFSVYRMFCLVLLFTVTFIYSNKEPGIIAGGLRAR